MMKKSKKMKTRKILTALSFEKSKPAVTNKKLVKVGALDHDGGDLDRSEPKGSREDTHGKGVDAKANEGTIRVISFDRIVLSGKWTHKLGLHYGDSLNIKLEDDRLMLWK